MKALWEGNWTASSRRPWSRVQISHCSLQTTLRSTLLISACFPHRPYPAPRTQLRTPWTRFFRILPAFLPACWADGPCGIRRGVGIVRLHVGRYICIGNALCLEETHENMQDRPKKLGATNLVINWTVSSSESGPRSSCSVCWKYITLSTVCR